MCVGEMLKMEWVGTKTAFSAKQRGVCDFSRIDCLCYDGQQPGCLLLHILSVRDEHDKPPWRVRRNILEWQLESNCH